MKNARRLLVSALLLLPAFIARGYMVGPAVGLDELTNKAEIIFQGTVISNTTIKDPDFQAIPGFLVQETEFQPAFTSKGKSINPNTGILFRHYAPDPSPMGMMYAPQSYTFEIGKNYIVFAKQKPGYPPDTCQQIWMSHTCMMDEGVLLCFSPFPYSHRSTKEMFWYDLTQLLKSKDPKEIVYAITHLYEFCGSSNDPIGDFGRLSEFQQLDVIDAVHGFITHPDPTVAQAALFVVGTHNPYMTRERAQYWLATVGSADTPGIGKMNPKMVNVGGLIYWREIAAIVDGKGDEATRALAVTALGLVREPSLQESIVRWLGDPSPAVRSSAVLLLADYPALATHDRFVTLATDADSETRISAAYAIGFAQLVESADVLTKLLSDPDAKVRQAASMSLLSFSPKDERITKIFRDNLANKEFAVLFLVALCQENPAGNLDLLIQQTVNKTDPTNWPGGQIPAYTTSHLLFKYLKSQPATDLQSGKYDRALDALEIWKPNYSVDPQFVYALELKDGLVERAKKFRASANKDSPYDLEIFFKRADQNPDAYLLD